LGQDQLAGLQRLVAYAYAGDPGQPATRRGVGWRIEVDQDGMQSIHRPLRCGDDALRMGDDTGDGRAEQEPIPIRQADRPRTFADGRFERVREVLIGVDDKFARSRRAYANDCVVGNR